MQRGSFVFARRVHVGTKFYQQLHRIERRLGFLIN